ncbi:MAG: hypothetical protein AABX11_01975 [Nanoarchaeota archaeon]
MNNSVLDNLWNEVHQMNLFYFRVICDGGEKVRFYYFRTFRDSGENYSVYTDESGRFKETFGRGLVSLGVSHV